MASSGLFASFSKILSGVTKGCAVQQTRTNFADARMLRDYNRRMVAKEYAPLRLRLLTMKRNTILPPELRKLAGDELNQVPRNACLNHLTGRCVITSRPRGNVRRWRVSRFVFRHLVDYNKLAGVQRALWG